jgi:hypothetical protein
MNENETLNEYKGYSLFNDVEDKELQARNRGVVLANLTEGGMQGDKVKHGATSEIVGYFQEIPVEQRQAALTVMMKTLEDRGITITDVVMN